MPVYFVCFYTNVFTQNNFVNAHVEIYTKKFNWRGTTLRILVLARHWHTTELITIES